MTTKDSAPRKGVALPSLRDCLPDIVGLIGFGLLTRGLWVGFGEAVALSVCGLILMVVSVASILRGGS